MEGVAGCWRFTPAAGQVREGCVGDARSGAAARLPQGIFFQS